MLHLHGVGHFHPENELTNAFFEELDIGTSDEWIVERTGIRSRRTVLPLGYIFETRNRDVRAASEAADYSTIELGRRAAAMAIERAGVDRSEIGLVIAGGSVPEYGTPAEACIVGDGLGISAPCLDMRSACTTFGAMLWSLSMMRPEKLPPYVLVVVSETVTRSVDYRDRASAVLWGDGAAAAVLSTAVPGRATIESTTFASDPGGHDKITVPWAGYFAQDGKAVQGFAVRTTSRLLAGLRDDLPEPEADRLIFVGHQANARMLGSVCRRCAIPDDRHLHNVERFGNTASAGSPSVLSEHWEEFRPGDLIGLVGVGAGLSWTSARIRFQDHRP
jgi:3-oxoacyl-[acyl-carrier-protein] synthase-3